MKTLLIGFPFHNQPTGIAWYRKHFKLPGIPKGCRVFMEFEGVRQAAEVYVNGHHLGSSENGMMAFGFDLTSYINAGDNVLAVRTDNRWTYREKSSGVTVQWNNNNFHSNFGGINKNVWLHITLDDLIATVEQIIENSREDGISQIRRDRQHIAKARRSRCEPHQP
jgi:hypothetical protein